MKFLLLFLVLTVGQVLTIPVDKGCEMWSEWIIGYTWPRIVINAWVPPGKAEEIMKIKTYFRDYDYPLTFDEIKIYRNRIQLDQMRNGKHSTVLKQKISMIDNGWAEFALTVDTHYGFEYLDKTLLAPNISVDYIPMTLLIYGSNITVDCPSKIRRWEIAESSVSVPLDISAEHKFSFFSTREFSPSVSLEGRERRLGWNNGTLTTIPSKFQPLPPFVQHHLTLTCQKHQRTVCTMKVGEDMVEAELMFLADIPQSISIKGMPDDEFFVFLHQDDPFSTPNEVVPDVIETYENTIGSSRYSFIVAVAEAVCLGLILVGLMVYYIYRKCCKSQEKEHKEGHTKGKGTMTSTSEKECSADTGRQKKTSLSEDLEKGWTSSQMNERNRDLRSLPTYTEAVNEDNSLL